MTDLATAPHPLLGKSTSALVVMLCLLAVPHAVPQLARYRIGHLPWEKARIADDLPSASVATTPKIETGETSLKASSNEGTVANALPTSSSTPAPPPDPSVAPKGTAAIDDPATGAGHAMDAFYKQLAKTDAKEPGAITRIMHYGDSVITSDLITGTLRRRMQQKYGDAGHGFILTANPWEWYFHNDVTHHAGEGWSSSRITGPLAGDGMYGAGGVTFNGAPGAFASFGTTDKGEFGRKVSRFDVYYLEQPSGGDGTATIGDATERFSTKGESKTSRVKSFAVADGASKLTLKAYGNGSFRVFGVALERDVPGVVVDALGMNGARIRLWDGMNAQHWRDQLALRKPALVVLQFGTNESEDPFGADYYEKGLRAVLEKVKAASPNASILVAAPLDRAEKGEDGKLRTKPVIKKLVASQEKVAKEAGVAFWNTYEAMGGEGAFVKWIRSNPQLGAGDLTHPTPAGAEQIGDMLQKALVSGYETWKSHGGK